MKYVKTFENFSEEMDAQAPQAPKMETSLKSPEVLDALAKIAEEEGADVDLVLQTADELADEPVKHNEEEDPFPTLMEWGQIGLGFVALFAGIFGIVKLSERGELKRYIQYKAEEEVKAAIKADPNLINKGYDSLIKAAFDRMMADKAFIDKVKQGSMHVPGTPRYRGFSATAGQL